MCIFGRIIAEPKNAHPMNAKLHLRPLHVENRIEELTGWKKEELLEVVRRMAAARANCTPFDAPGAAGARAYYDGTEQIRYLGSMHEGWSINDDNNIPSTYSRDRQIKVAVCNTNEGTGLEHGYPQNRQKKGTAVEALVASNHQLYLPGFENVPMIQPKGSGVVFWYLCVYAEGDDVRAELSCPVDCEGGFLSGFRERIILLGADGDGGKMSQRKNPPDEDSGFEINVTRKQA